MLAFRVSESEYRELQQSADYLVDGNLSQLIRNYVLGTHKDYKLLRRFGIIQTVMFFRNLSPSWRRYREQQQG
jgi:hypothetical protein